jgi:hypothetical protein
MSLACDPVTLSLPEVMQIHVARNSAQLGIFSPEEIIAGLQSGRFAASDLAWRDGMAAWTPLGDWAEFRAAVMSPTPGRPAAEAPPASMIPWEQGKSLGSFFATFKMAIVNPSGLANGRFAFGEWAIFSYLAVALSLPFQITHALLVGNQNAAVGEFIQKLDIPQLNPFAEQMLKTPPAPIGFTIFGLVMGLAFAPLVYAFCGLIHWVGQRIFRLKISVERTVAATLLASALLIVLMAPLQLLGANFFIQIIFSCFLLIPACVVYYRTLGAATGVSPWAQFGISTLVWFVLTCCCCALPLGLFAGVLSKSLPH